MIRRPPRSTRMTHSFPTRRSSDLGAKPKPAHLRLVDGTHRNTRHGKKEEVAAAVEATNSIFGALHRPSYLKGEARKAWDRYIAPMTWLDPSREPSAILF